MPRTFSKANKDFETFRTVQHPEVHFHHVFSDAPVNDSYCFRKAHDCHWQFGIQPKSSAELASMPHRIRHIAPKDRAVQRQGIVNGLAFGGSSNQSDAGDPAMRDRASIKADLIDCMVALPGQIFCSTRTHVCLLVLQKDENADAATFGLN